MNTENKTKKKVKASTVISNVILALAIVIAAYILICRVSGKMPSVLGYSAVTILTDSMDTDGEKPDIPAGTYVLIKKTDAKNIRVGDIVTFYSTDEAIAGSLNTHEVIEIITGENGEISFRTQGRNRNSNPVPDKNPAESQNLVGKFVCKLNVLTFIIKLLSNKLVLIGLIVALGAVIAVSSALGKKKKPDGTTAA